MKLEKLPPQQEKLMQFKPIRPRGYSIAGSIPATFTKSAVI